MLLTEQVKWWRQADYLFGAGLTILRVLAATRVFLTVSSDRAAAASSKGSEQLPSLWGAPRGLGELAGGGGIRVPQLNFVASTRAWSWGLVATTAAAAVVASRCAISRWLVQETLDGGWTGGGKSRVWFAADGCVSSAALPSAVRWRQLVCQSGRAGLAWSQSTNVASSQ